MLGIFFATCKKSTPSIALVFIYTQESTPLPIAYCLLRSTWMSVSQVSYESLNKQTNK
jgi:hypothetical protein